jgi:hypothetical protein
MKKLILMVLLLFPCLAFANIGDTMQQSVRRYGKPVNRNGNLYIFHKKGWIISEWFDPSTGYAATITYCKFQGVIERAETDTIMEVNLPAKYCDGEQWILTADNSNDASKLYSRV